MAQPNPPGRKQGEDLLTEDPEYKRKNMNKTDEERNRDAERNTGKENVQNRAEKKENYDDPSGAETDGKKNPGTVYEKNPDDDEVQ